MILAGVVTAAVWNGVLKLSGSIYEVLPGMSAGFLVYGVAQFFNFAKGISRKT